MGQRGKHMGFIYPNIRDLINILLLYKILFLALNLHNIIIAYNFIYMCWVKNKRRKTEV